MLPGMGSHKLAGAVSPGGALINVIAGFYAASSFYPAGCSCGFTYGNSGNVTNVGSDAAPGDGPWKLTAAPSSDYDIRLTIDGSVGAWQNLSTSKSYTISRSLPSGSGEPSVSTVFIEIRRASDLVVLGSGTSTLSVYVEPG